MKRIPELDGIRGVAIGLVLLWHFVFGGMEAAAPGTFWSYVKAAGRLTWSGVDLFFVLSGFLIGGILVDTRDSPNYFRSFYARRFFRIVPLYLAVLCVALAGNRGSIDPQIPTFSYFAFPQNFWMARFATLGVLLAPTWSLAVEEQFYLTLPSVVRFVGRRHLGYVLAAGILAAPCLRILCLQLWPANEIAPYVLMPCRADALLLGAIGALAIRNARAARWMKDNGGTMSALLMLFAAGALVLTNIPPPIALLRSALDTVGSRRSTCVRFSAWSRIQRLGWPAGCARAGSAGLARSHTAFTWCIRWLPLGSFESSGTRSISTCAILRTPWRTASPCS